MNGQRALVLAVVLDVLGAAGALLFALREWQTVSVDRVAPLHDVVLPVTGRTVDSAPTALALVALAGVVALLATKGFARRIVGGVLLATGVGLAWRSAGAASAMDNARARSVLADQRRSLDLTGVAPHVASHPAWPVLSAVGGVLVVAAGVLVTWRGSRWRPLSSRYEAPNPATTSSGMWTVLDRGDDPTA